ncbi:MAG: cytochrome b N-terminal domain-containing protein [Acidobacteria bacterium]|nr:cytochrome b N-terminal domain-containing protein [Acidobacteriota bacterium]
MPENSEGGKGKKGLAGLLEREQIQALKEKVKEDTKALQQPTKTDLYKSIFRVKHDETPRSRALGVLTNVFLHLHPAKINRDAVAYNYTWGMGGITFYLFIVLTFTGTLLMFYYHPSKVVAFRDILYLEHDVPFGKLLRNMHRWAAHLMIITVWLHMFRVFLTGSYKKPREFNWVVGVILLVLTLLLSFTASTFMVVHFWRVRKDGGISGPSPMVLESEIKPERKF